MAPGRLCNIELPPVLERFTRGRKESPVWIPPGRGLFLCLRTAGWVSSSSMGDLPGGNLVFLHPAQLVC